MKVKVHMANFERDRKFYPSRKGIERMIKEHPLLETENPVKIVIEPISKKGNLIGYQLIYHFCSRRQYPVFYPTNIPV